MSEQIRRLLASRKFENLQVPAGFDKNVGNRTQRIPVTGNQPYDMSDLEAEVLGRKPKAKFVPQRGVSEPLVEQAGFDLVASFQKAAEQLGTKKKGTDPLAPLAEHVAIVARNARDGGDGTPTVLADTAAALLAVDAPTRDMILRRAGNPPEFEALRNSGLADTPSQLQTQLFGQDVNIDDPKAVQRGQALAEASKRVDREEADIERASSVERLPMIKRESSHFNRPAKMKADGSIATPSEQVKNYRIDDNSPLDVEGPKDKDKPLTPRQKAALNRLAGDQIGEVKQIVKTYDSAVLPQQVTPSEAPPILKRTESQPKRKPSPGQSRVLEIAQQGERTREELAKAAGVSAGTVQGLIKSGLLDYAGQVAEMPQGRQMHIGSDPNFWKPGDARRIGRPTADMEVEYRNQSQAENILQKLYELTAPQTALDGGSSPVNLMADNTTTIDMDATFPWWRGRFADMDDSGKLVYPNRIPTPEFITGLVESRLKVTDPGFYDRVLPLIKRSIEAAPDTPDPYVKSEGRTAHQYSQIPFLPSPSFEKVMRQAVKERTSTEPVYHPTGADIHMPFSIYGPRAVDRPTMDVPERNPFTGKNAVDPAAEDRKSEYRRLLGEPGLGDQSSIYKMPSNSPMRLLLA
jgi:hypothetical protein